MNTFSILILDNGNVRIETGKFSATTHTQAEAALKWITDQLGGDSDRQRLTHTHTHLDDHHHDHNHVHAA